MRTLRTATGKEYYCSLVTKGTEQSIYIKLLIEPNEAMQVFLDPEETKTLQWIDESGDILREDRFYTKFTELAIMEDSACPVRLRMELNLDAVIWDRFDEIEEIRQEVR